MSVVLLNLYWWYIVLILVARVVKE